MGISGLCCFLRLFKIFQYSLGFVDFKLSILFLIFFLCLRMFKTKPSVSSVSFFNYRHYSDWINPVFDSFSKLNNKTEHNKLFQTLGRTHVKHADFKILPLVFLIHFWNIIIVWFINPQFHLINSHSLYKKMYIIECHCSNILNVKLHIIEKWMTLLT